MTTCCALREVREEMELEAESVEQLVPIEYWFWWSVESAVTLLRVA